MLRSGLSSSPRTKPRGFLTEIMKQTDQTKCVIAIDGGGTKTLAVLADLNGKILAAAKTGPSSPRNLGIAIATENIVQAIKKLLKGDEIAAAIIGLASVQEQPKYKNQIKKEILKNKQIAKALKGKLEIVSDQLTAFRSGSDEKDGIVLISGTGCVAHGWRGKKETHSSGWGWLNDEGSAFWLGQQALQAILKDLDDRGPKTKITQIAFQELKAKSKEDLMNKIYANPMVITPLFSVFCDLASQKKDFVAKKLMEQAGQELALSTKTVIKSLDLQKTRFPLVLVGSMFKSDIVLKTVKKQVRAFAKKADFILPKHEPVIGAVKIALEKLRA